MKSGNRMVGHEAARGSGDDPDPVIDQTDKANGGLKRIVESDGAMDKGSSLKILLVSETLNSTCSSCKRAFQNIPLNKTASSS